MSDQEYLFSIRDVAKKFGVERTTALVYVQRYKPKITKTINRQYFFNEQELIDFQFKVEAHKQQAKESRRISFKRGPKRLKIDNSYEKEIIQKWGVNKNDNSSIDVEIGMLSEKIKDLKIKIDSTDINNKFEWFCVRLHLIKTIGQRRKALQYLRETDFSRYERALKKLNMKY